MAASAELALLRLRRTRPQQTRRPQLKGTGKLFSSGFSLEWNEFTVGPNSIRETCRAPTKLTDPIHIYAPPPQTASANPRPR